jgi:hypothetical protein
MSFNFRYFGLFALAALSAQACVIRWGDGSSLADDDSYSWTDEDDSSSVAATVGGGAGGAGGNAANDGGDSGPMCTDYWGAGTSVDVCETLAISPSNTTAVCGETPGAVGYLSCVKGFELFSEGVAEEYAACLSEITPAEACEFDPVAQCTDRIYNNACEQQGVTDLCEEMNDYCVGIGDSLDVNSCSATLNPMSEEAITELIECMNWSPTGTCQERYNSCFDELVTIE